IKLIKIPIYWDTVSRYWLVSGMNKPIGDWQSTLKIPSLSLRGLTDSAELSSLILNAITENLLYWSDCEFTNHKMEHLAWMGFLMKFEDLRSWKSCLQVGANKINNDEVWYFWIVENLILKSLWETSEIKFDQTINILLELFPTHTPILPFALIS